MSVSIAFSRSSLDITAPDPAKSLTSSFVPMIVTDSTKMSSSALTLTINDKTKRISSLSDIKTSDHGVRF